MMKKAVTLAGLFLFAGNVWAQNSAKVHELKASPQTSIVVFGRVAKQSPEIRIRSVDLGLPIAVR